jgi:hypothetical protein
MDDDGDPQKDIETLFLTDDAIRAMKDRKMKVQPLVLSGKPNEPKQSPTFLKTKYQIGGINGPVDFGRKQVAFHRDDIPAKKLENVESLLQWKKENSNKCGVSKKWNQSSQPDNIIIQKRSRENSDHDRSHMYQYNYRSEVLPEKNLMHIPNASKWKVNTIPADVIESVTTAKAGSRLLSGSYKRTQEMPVNPKLEGKKEWCPDSKQTKAEIMKRIARTTELARQSSEKGKNALDPDEYMNPQERYEKFKDGVRILKATGLTRGYAANMNAKEEIPKHNRLAKEYSRKERTFHHSGVYEYNKTEDLWMWSDTGSFELEGPGDVTRVKDPFAYNLASPNSIG